MASTALSHNDSDISQNHPTAEARYTSDASTESAPESSSLLVPDPQTPTLQGQTLEAPALHEPEAAAQVNKTETTATVTSTEPHCTNPESARNHWLAPKPLLGLLSLAVAVFCVFFSLAILVTSNDKPIRTWSIQPTVYLAIASAVANTAVTFAFAQAAVTAWWYRASKGATIHKLERQWEASFTLSHAIVHLRDGKLPGFPMLAGILVVCMIADGPLLQRASSVAIATQSEVVALNFSLTPELPTGFSGTFDYSSVFVAPVALDTTRDWTAGTPIPFSVSPSCEGQCIGKAKGPGMTPQNCDTIDWPVTYDMFHGANSTWGGDAATILNNTVSANPYFQISLTPYDLGDDPSTLSETASLDIGIIHIVNSTGKYSQTTCRLFPAILEYDVLFTSDGHVELSPDSAGEVVSLVNNTHAYNISNLEASQPNTLGWLLLTLQTFVGTNCSAEPPLPGAPADSPSGSWDMAVLDYNSQCFKYINWTSVAKQTYLFDGSMDISFHDPTPSILHSLNEMMFRAAVLTTSWANVTQLTDPGLSINQSTLANQTVTRNVFHSDFRWYGAATALELLVAFSVLPMFWGWWKVDKHLTLSPLSFGLAFNAPILKGADPSKGADGVVKQMGDVQIRYDGVFREKQGGSDSEAVSLDSRSGFVRM